MKKLIAFVILSLASSLAFASDPGGALGLGTTLMDRFAAVLQGFENVIRPTAMTLFVTLMLIENSVWAMKQLTNDGFQLESITGKVVWNIFVWGVFFWLLRDSHTIMKAIIDSFFKIGQNSTGLGPLDAVGMMYLGVQTGLAIPQAADIGAFSFFDKPIIVLTAIIAMFLLVSAFVVTAAQLFMAQVEAMIVISCAPLILAFGGLSFTRDIATKVLSHALGTGVKILTIYIIAGVMAKMGPEISAVLLANSSTLMSSPGQMLEVIAVSGLMTLLAFQVPSIAGAMLSGQSSMSGNSAISSTLGIAAGGAIAGMMGLNAAKEAAGGLAKGAGGAAAGAAGLAQALGSAYDAAGDVGKTGMSGAVHAAGTVAGQALGMMAGGVGDAVASSTNRFADRVASSTGGKIAANIEAGRGGNMSQASGSSSGDASAGASSGGAASADASSGGDAPGGASSAGAAPAAASSGGAAPAGRSSAGAAPSGGSSNNPAPAPQANLSGFVPSDMGNASTASISGGSSADEKKKSKLGSLTDMAANALGSTHDALSRTKEHVIEDRTTVGANIDTKLHL